MFPSWLTLKASLITIAGVVVVSGLIIGLQQWRISGLQETIERKDTALNTLTGDLAVSNANVATLKATTERQNLAIQKLQADKAAMDAKTKQAALEALKKRENVPIGENGVSGMNKFFRDLLL